MGVFEVPSPGGNQRETLWDSDLFRVLPAVLDAGDGAAAQENILAWIEELGEVNAPTAEAKLPDDLALPPRLDC